MLIVSLVPFPCTAQLFAVDIAASEQAREMRYVLPGYDQDPIARLREVLTFGARLHAQAWPSPQ